MISRFATATLRALRPATVLALSLCIALFLFRSIHWPLLGDASLLHYVVFLAKHGATPYRDIAEMNMPGSYFVEWGAMRLFGGGALAWRVFDIFLLATAILSMVVITLPIDWFAGFWAGSIFLLLHGRDGIFDLGQRDLTAAICMLAACALLFTALRKNRPSLALVFGLLAGLAGTTKPPLLMFGPLLLVVAYFHLKKAGRSRRALLIYGASGVLLPYMAAFLWLWQQQALPSFLSITSAMVRYHASLARRPMPYLALHSFSPAMPLLLLLLLTAFLQRRRIAWESACLLIGLAVGLLSYVSQGKVYAYQRYPFLAFLLLIMSLQFSAALKAKGVLRYLGIAGFAFGSFVLAPVSTAMAIRYDWKDTGTVGMLQEDLGKLGAQELSGGVQCVDSISGCTNALYLMKLEEPSKIFYDEFLFGPDSAPAVELNRRKLMSDLLLKPPAVIVVTDRLFPSGPDNYEKLSRWPQFKRYLDQQYFLCSQRAPTQPVRWWSRPEVPAGYRIYLRKSAAQPAVPKEKARDNPPAAL